MLGVWLRMALPADKPIAPVLAGEGICMPKPADGTG